MKDNMNEKTYALTSFEDDYAFEDDDSFENEDEEVGKIHVERKDTPVFVTIVKSTTGMTDDDFMKMMADAKKRLAAFKNETIAKLAPKYPEAKFGDLFIMNYRAMVRECAPCAECTGYPCAKKVEAGIIKKVEYDFGIGDLAVTGRLCKYRISHDNKIRAQKMFSNSRIPKKYVGKTFKDYEVTADNENAVNAAHYILNEEPKSLYFFGESGTGKTFLVSIIAQELLKRGQSVIFSDVPSLFNKLRTSFAKNSKVDIEDMMATLEEADVLILDDLGTELVTEWATGQLYDLINARYNERRQVLITSNYTLGELEERLNNPRDAKPDVMGSRISSRLMEMCGRVHLKGKDYRLKR